MGLLAAFDVGFIKDGFRGKAMNTLTAEMGRKAAVMRAGKPEFPNDYSAHHFHVGCAIFLTPIGSQAASYGMRK